MSDGDPVQPSCSPAAAPAADGIAPSRQAELTRRWTRGIVACLAVGLSLTVLRVAQLKVAPPAQLDAAAGWRTSLRKEVARRGEVLDARGRPLAMSLVGYRLFCDPAFIYERGWDLAKDAAKKDPTAVAECDPFRDAAIELSKVLRQPPQAIHELLKANAERRYVVLSQEIDEQQLDAIRTLDLDGVGLESRLVRDYPAGGLAGQLIGKVGFEHAGQAGVEFAFDKELRPVDGRVKALRDAFGRTLWINRDDYVPGDPGQDVRLSLDLAVQEIAERHLGHMVEEVNAGGGRLIVMDTGTGDILAMADFLQERPGWKEATRDPARRIHPSLGRNRNVTDPYEPGSTFKSFVWARATQLGAAKPSEIIPLPNGPFVTGFGRTIHDVKYPGPVSWKTVLVKSLNGGMACVAMRLKHHDLQQMVSDFGFGQKVGIGISGESSGIVTRPAKWSKYTQTSVAMGHEIAVTPVQMVRAFSAFARKDGSMVQPRLVLPRGTSGSDDWLPGSKQLITPDVLAEAKDAMTGVVEEGTARKAKSEHYQMYGKTGTAELAVPGQRGYDRDRYVASFLAAAPLENPRIVVLCIIDDPDKRKGHFGGSIAGPVVRDVVDETLQYLGVPYDRQPAKPKDPKVASR
ncbi:MAG: peptidoglycan D,D-transpeptidase FtsI family protein [Planctomycetota bacterium]